MQRNKEHEPHVVPDMIIDSHQHFWNYQPARHAWISEEMQPLRRNFLPQDLQPLLETNGVDGCVAVQAEMSETETEFLLASAAAHPFIRGVVGWVDLCADSADEQLAHYAANPLLKGIRHQVQDEVDDHFVLRPDFQRGIGMLSRYGLAYDILIYPRQLPASILLAKRFPEQRFVLDHLGKPAISGGVDPEWLTGIKALAAQPNVCCKLSGMVTETAGFQWKKEDFHPFMDAVLQAFGANRLLFGSDWPVCLLASDYSRVKEVVTSYLQTLSKNERAAVMGENAMKIYKL